MNLDQLIDGLLKREGGYNDNPADKGGPTNFGITLKTLQNWRGDFTLTANDVRYMEEWEARNIYESLYYKPGKIADIPESLRDIMLDTCVNFGVPGAWRLVQAALNDQGNGLTADGVPGAKSLVAINACDQQRAIKDVVRHRVLYRDQRAVQDGKQVEFLKGWHQRDLSFV